MSDSRPGLLAKLTIHSELSGVGARWEYLDKGVRTSDERELMDMVHFHVDRLRIRMAEPSQKGEFSADSAENSPFGVAAQTLVLSVTRVPGEHGGMGHPGFGFTTVEGGAHRRPIEELLRVAAAKLDELKAEGDGLTE